MKPIIIICAIILTFFYFMLYHKFFPTIFYFKNPISCILSELFTCFMLGLFTAVLLGQLFSYVLGVIGRILLFLIKIVIALSATGGAAYGAYKIADKIKKNELQSNKNNWIAAVISGTLVFILMITVMFGKGSSNDSNTGRNDLPNATSSYVETEDDFSDNEQTEDEEEADYIPETEESITEEHVRDEVESKETYEETTVSQEFTSADPTYNSEIQEEEYVLPGSDIEDVSMMGDIVMTMEPKWLRIAKNEIFARHGRMFSDPEIQAYFDSKEWYYGYIKPDDFDMNTLTEIEKSNIEFLDMLYKNSIE